MGVFKYLLEEWNKGRRIELRNVDGINRLIILYLLKYIVYGLKVNFKNRKI